MNTCLWLLSRFRASVSSDAGRQRRGSDQILAIARSCGYSLEVL